MEIKQLLHNIVMNKTLISFWMRIAYILRSFKTNQYHLINVMQVEKSMK